MSTSSERLAEMLLSGDDSRSLEFKCLTSFWKVLKEVGDALAIMVSSNSFSK